MQLQVDTDGVNGSAIGIQHISEQLTRVRADLAVHSLGDDIRGGALAEGAGAAAAEWQRLLATIVADVELTAHAYQQSTAHYEAVERRLASFAAHAGAFLTSTFGRLAS